MSSSESNRYANLKWLRARIGLHTRRAGLLSIPILVYVSVCSCSAPKLSSSAHPSSVTAQEATLARVRRQPGDLAARLQLAELYASSGETFAAIEQMEIARELGGKDESLILRLAG